MDGRAAAGSRVLHTVIIHHSTGRNRVRGSRATATGQAGSDTPWELWTGHGKSLVCGRHAHARYEAHCTGHTMLCTRTLYENADRAQHGSSPYPPGERREPGTVVDAGRDARIWFTEQMLRPPHHWPLGSVSGQARGLTTVRVSPAFSHISV